MDPGAPLPPNTSLPSIIQDLTFLPLFPTNVTHMLRKTLYAKKKTHTDCIQSWSYKCKPSDTNAFTFTLDLKP